MFHEKSGLPSCTWPIVHVLLGEAWNYGGFVKKKGVIHVYFAAGSTSVFFWLIWKFGIPILCSDRFFSRTAGEKDGVEEIAKRTAFVTLATEDYSQGALVLTVRWHKIKLELLDETWLKLWFRDVNVWDSMESHSAGWLAVSTATVGGCDRFQWCRAGSRARPQEFTKILNEIDALKHIETLPLFCYPLLPMPTALMDTTHAFVKSPFHRRWGLLSPMRIFFGARNASVCFRRGDKTTLHFAWCAYLWLCGWTPVVLILAPWWFVTVILHYDRFLLGILRIDLWGQTSLFAGKNWVCGAWRRTWALKISIWHNLGCPPAQ